MEMNIIAKVSIKLYLLFCLIFITGCQLSNPYLGRDVEDLVIALKEPTPHNRVLAARALQTLGPDASDAIPALVERLFDREASVRIAARDAMVAIGPEAVEPLFLAFDRSIEQWDSSDIVAENISEGISLFEVNAIPEFTRIFYKYEPRSRERGTVVSALSEMIDRKGKDASAAAPVLVIAQGDPWPPTQVEASEALTKLGESAVPDLISGLSNPETKVRYHSAVVLGRIGPEAIEAGPSLVLVLDDRVPDVRAAAVVALEKIGFPFEYSPSRSQRMDDLFVALNDPNPEIRAATAEALGTLGAEAESALHALLFVQQNDPDPAVREAAENAIKKIRSALN